MQNPIIMLSIVNTLLRDKCPNLEALAKYLDEEYGTSITEVSERLKAIGYEYSEAHNQFVSKCDE